MSHVVPAASAAPSLGISRCCHTLTLLFVGVGLVGHLPPVACTCSGVIPGLTLVGGRANNKSILTI